MSANLEQVKKVLSDAMKDSHRYWKEKLQACTLIEEVYPWLRSACPELGGKGGALVENYCSRFSVFQS